MRCISCGIEMRLVQVQRDDSMMVPGYARETLQCLHCNEVEHRLVFSCATQAQPADPAPAVEAALAPVTPTIALLSDAERELDEREALLRHAIAMVRSPARSFPAKRAPRRVVQIRHDPSYEAEYAAADATSGVVVLRHQDRTRLWAMCDRLGWQVAEGSPS
jgi:hypothetical protein